MKNKRLQDKVTAPERKKYILSTQRDLKILKKCKQLKKMKLNTEDRQLIRLIETQLMRDWRKPLLAELSKLLKKYSQGF